MAHFNEQMDDGDQEGEVISPTCEWCGAVCYEPEVVNGYRLCPSPCVGQFSDAVEDARIAAIEEARHGV